MRGWQEATPQLKRVPLARKEREGRVTSFPGPSGHCTQSAKAETYRENQTSKNRATSISQTAEVAVALSDLLCGDTSSIYH